MSDLICLPKALAEPVRCCLSLDRFCAKVYRLAVRPRIEQSAGKRRFAKAAGAATYSGRGPLPLAALDHDKDARAPSQ
ncbi:hypothetical protein [Sphingorhabdus sp. SMR4y]|uniref:hypothetical protein n=1 Tax=Sphingorhabdus sp. SMR4y TaxID=2584094 RepID=UPI000B5CD351|nr:hypothetical protein [Sphingorhabdus sp. SMR4y]ASK88302.1 hypothetical protein SPHFLASMR4Y_01553 [Sphingorhabdus sp. SMR4y]